MSTALFPHDNPCPSGFLDFPSGQLLSLYLFYLEFSGFTENTAVSPKGATAALKAVTAAPKTATAAPKAAAAHGTLLAYFGLSQFFCVCSVCVLCV